MKRLNLVAPIKYQPLQIFASKNVAMILLLLTACSIHLISNYDEIIDQGITQFQKIIDIHLIAMESNPNQPFRQGFFDSLHADLRVLKTRASATPQNDETIIHINNLSSQVDSVEVVERHGLSSFLYDSLAATSIDDDCQHALKLELAKKR
jgi:hypothetical protein